MEHATTDDVTKSVTLLDILQEIPVQLTSNKKIDKIITKPKNEYNWQVWMSTMPHFRKI